MRPLLRTTAGQPSSYARSGTVLIALSTRLNEAAGRDRHGFANYASGTSGAVILTESIDDKHQLVDRKSVELHCLNPAYYRRLSTQHRLLHCTVRRMHTSPPSTRSRGAAWGALRSPAGELFAAATGVPWPGRGHWAPGDDVRDVAVGPGDLATSPSLSSGMRTSRSTFSLGADAPSHGGDVRRRGTSSPPLMPGRAPAAAATSHFPFPAPPLLSSSPLLWLPTDVVWTTLRDAVALKDGDDDVEMATAPAWPPSATLLSGDIRAPRRRAPLHLQPETPPCGVRAAVNGRELAIFRYRGVPLATDARCPHAGGDMCAGDIEELGVVVRKPAVVCPSHGYAFDAASGRCVRPGGTWRVNVYPARVGKSGRVEVGFAALDGTAFAMGGIDF